MDSNGNPSQIFLKGDMGERYEEGRAAGTIKPGHLIKLNGDNELVVHATAGGFAERAIAIEAGLLGKTIDDNYADDDLVHYVLGRPGEECYMWLAAGKSVDEGDHLVSAGDGTLDKAAGSEKQVIAVAREAKDLTALPAARIKVRLL